MNRGTTRGSGLAESRHMQHHDLIVIGSSPAAESLATEAREAGLTDVLVTSDEGDITVGPDGRPVLAQETGDATARAVAIVDTSEPPPEPSIDIPESLAGRIHTTGVPDSIWDADLLVFGGSEAAAETALGLAVEGTRVVLVRGDVSPNDLSRATQAALLLREAERRLTVLWRSRPTAIHDIDGDPLVEFDTFGTPELVFDHVLIVDDATRPGPDTQTGPVWRVGSGTLPAGRAWQAIRAGSFPEIPEPETVKPTATSEELRERHYNSTITYFERTHSDLWLIRVRPDHGDVSHAAGQYASLGLGYWEPRSDTARDPGLERKWANLARRSYSISSPVFEENGYLHDPAHHDDLEFYIVLVPPTPERIPVLTPRLALKQPGDRIYVGPRIVGRYTLAPVADPSCTVVFLATGTGEAPHNAMIVELLRKGHTGPIVSAVSVRYREDLAYLDTHRRLEARFPNYHYLPLVTRDPGSEKIYIQDALSRGMLEDRFGVIPDPATTHVYMCGNPSMIGLPTWDNDTPSFPDTPGTCQWLFEHGFDLDRHGHTGNVHTEKYW